MAKSKNVAKPKNVLNVSKKDSPKKLSCDGKKKSNKLKKTEGFAAALAAAAAKFNKMKKTTRKIFLLRRAAAARAAAKASKIKKTTRAGSTAAAAAAKFIRVSRRSNKNKPKEGSEGMCTNSFCAEEPLGPRTPCNASGLQ